MRKILTKTRQMAAISASRLNLLAQTSSVLVNTLRATVKKYVNPKLSTKDSYSTQAKKYKTAGLLFISKRRIIETERQSCANSTDVAPAEMALGATTHTVKLS